jgi:hypothetical protein
MRVVLVALISALAAIGCEKDPPASDAAKQPASTSAAPSKAAANQPVPVEVVQDDEPMDDVDDEPSDKAGAADPPAEGKGDEPEGDEVEDE